MIAINEIPYKNLARMLLSRIKNAGYFNGTIEFDTEEYHSELRLTIIIYREQSADQVKDGTDADRIIDVIPVWWEYNTYQECGQVTNDFSWNEFCEYLF